MIGTLAKKFISEKTSRGPFKYSISGSPQPAEPQMYHNPVNVGDHIYVDFAYNGSGCAALVLRVEHSSEKSTLTVESFEKELASDS